jgi:hypothetical protein
VTVVLTVLDTGPTTASAEALASGVAAGVTVAAAGCVAVATVAVRASAGVPA